MSRITKAKAASKNPEETSGWKPRITERVLPSGAVSFMADWWERKDDKRKDSKGYKHLTRQYPTRAELHTWLAAEHKTRSDKLAQAAAEAELVREAEKRGDNVVTLANLTPKERAALAQAIETIRAAGGRVETVADAADFYKSTHLQGAKKTIAEVVAEQLAEIEAGRRPATFMDRRRNLAPLVKDHGGELVAAMGRETARAWIMAANTLSMKAARKRALHALFNYAWEKGYVEANPAKKIKVDETSSEEVTILTPGDAAEVLRRAEEHAPRLVPYLAIGLFAGLRPMNELRGVVWERDIVWKAKKIKVTRKSSKNNRSRLVPISSNLLAWLKAVPKAQRRGNIFYSRRLLDWLTGREPKKDRRIKHPGKLAAALKKKGRPSRKRFEPLSWGQDIMRHTRTSYRLAETKNEPLVAYEGGHTLTIMKRHYANQTIPDADAKKFWNIMPTKAARKGKQT